METYTHTTMFKRKMTQIQHILDIQRSGNCHFNYLKSLILKCMYYSLVFCNSMNVNFASKLIHGSECITWPVSRRLPTRHSYLSNALLFSNDLHISHQGTEEAPSNFHFYFVLFHREKNMPSWFLKLLRFSKV